MAQASFVDDRIFAFDFGQRVYSGPNLTVGNLATTSANRVTKAQLAASLWSSVKADYNAGKTIHYLPVIAEDDALENVELATADDLEIEYLVIGAMQGAPANGYNDRFYNPASQSPEGNPLHLTVKAKTGEIMICKYTGTAPSPTSATFRLRYVCTSSTKGFVAIPTTDGVAQQYGSKVICVSTALELVAIIH